MDPTACLWLLPLPHLCLDWNKFVGIYCCQLEAKANFYVQLLHPHVVHRFALCPRRTHLSHLGALCPCRWRCACLLLAASCASCWNNRFTCCRQPLATGHFCFRQGIGSRLADLTGKRQFTQL